MENIPALSTAQSRKIYVGSEFKDSLPLLDVLHANEFEEENFDPELIEKTEEDFYRGAPPSWLNFHISEQAKLDGTGTLFVKRDGYETLKKQIQEKRKLPGISTVKLFHQSGCGGTTMAKQVLWDLRKTFRCAALTGSNSDITEVAKEVIQLFTAGNRGHQNTVLLLLNDEQILDNLQSSIFRMIAENNMVTYRPAVIFLNCVRKESLLESNHVVLQRELSDAEKQRFSEKKNEIVTKYGNKTKQFHGFNIMQTNFSLTYIKEACTVFKSVQKAKRPRKAQLAAFLSLLNAYVPGSYLLESQCLAFLRMWDSIDGALTVEELMQPFGHLVISFQQDGRAERKVRMAHPMIAKCCTELMAAGGVTRSDTARNLLNSFYSNDEDADEFPQYLLGFVKDMLTRRETKTEENPVGGSDSKEDQERFSRLILDIQKKEKCAQSASVLKVATKKFPQNPYFPQALARFYYIEIKDYNQAEIWAETAKQRDPQNSFIADTLGQVHKNHLKKEGLSASPREILKLAKRAIEAFKHEEQLSEDAQGMDMKDDGITKVSTVFNSRGQFGFLQVCNILYDLLVRQNETWKSVLTKRVSLYSALETLGDTKLYRFNGLINSLRGEVEKKSDFFDKYLTYSKLSIEKNDPDYISRDASDCRLKYVGVSPPTQVNQKIVRLMEMLKQNLAATSAGVLACLDRENTESEIQEITSLWGEICSSKSPGRAEVNYILAHIMLMNTGVTPPFKRKPFTAFRQRMPLNIQDPPEEHMLALLLCWPSDSEDEHELDQLIQRMHRSYEIAYKKYFRSRYLCPLFFIGKGEGLNRIVHRKVLEGLLSEESQDTAPDWTHNWRNEKTFENPKVQKLLLKVEGEVQNLKVYANVRDTKIEVEVNLERMLWRPRRVSFYLGFTIRGPVAFGIQTETPDQGPPGKLKLEPSDCDMDSCHWTKLEPEVKRVDGVKAYSLRSHGGSFECAISSLRWVCREHIRFSYQFRSWENHREKPVCIGYMPAGPLMDISLTAGKMEKVYLPHWIDTESTTSDMFTVLHVDACGDSVQQVSEVMPHHVKLVRPTFSPNGVMFRMKLGIPVKVYHDVLIFKTKMEFLTLHLYLVPPDPDLQEKVVIGESGRGSIMIPKPNPDKSLQISEDFLLKSDADVAEISPEKMKLRYKRRTYFEVFLRNVDGDFKLQLQTQKKDKLQEIVWTCTLRKGDYQSLSTDHLQDQHFVDVHFLALIDRVKDTKHILDKLLDMKIILSETYDDLRAITSVREQMREILKLVISAGKTAKDDFYKILKKMKNLKPLLSELEAR